MRRLYIKGMEMPRCCIECRLAVCRVRKDKSYIFQCQALEGKGNDVIDYRGEGRRKRRDNCPLEEK